MRIKKVVTIIFCILAFTTFVKLIMIHSDIDEANDYIYHYLTEPKNIVFEVRGEENSLSNISYYPRKAEYSSVFNRLSKGYEEVASNYRVMDSEISYYLPNVRYEKSYFEIIGCDKTDKEVFVDGYLFKGEDITAGKNVVIISQGMKNNKGQEIKVGDVISIESPDLGEAYAVDLTVVGFYFEENYESRLYMPNKAIERISKKWFALENYPGYRNTYSDRPVGISNPTFSCLNERDYAYLVEMIDEFMELSHVEYEIVRLDGHVEELPNVAQMEKEAKYCWYILGIITFVYFILIKILHVNELKQEEEFEKSLIEQQEKYVSNLIYTNQETHRLKHDMKHFFNHLYYAIENCEKEEVLKMIQDVQQDIYQVETPVFTNNKSFNVVMNIFKERAKNEGFDFNYSGVTNVRLNVQERKLFVLLSNALDNAFVHNNQNKKVKIKIDDVHGYYRIMILNTTDLKVLDHDRKPFGGHGYGLKSIRQIVKDVKGDFDIHVENGWFTCVLLLPKSN